jgi:hypothetical protein
MKRPRPLDLMVVCTSGHEDKVMLICSRIDPADRRDWFLSCPTCNRTIKLVVNPRLETTIYFNAADLN